MRVSNDHWATLLEFSEVHNEIITNRFSTHFNGKQKNAELWKELTTKLNSLGQGETSVEEWKKKLADWKSKTKAKSAKIYKYNHGTGGGPAINITLSTLETKLLNLMGHVAAYGDKSVTEKGLKRKISELTEKEEQCVGSTGSQKKCEQTTEDLYEGQLFNVSWNHEKDQEADQNIVEEIILEYSDGPSIENNVQSEIKSATNSHPKRNMEKTEEKTKYSSNNSKVDLNSMHEDILKSLENINENTHKELHILYKFLWTISVSKQ